MLVSLNEWISQNTDLVFRIGLLGFLFGVILMLVDKDFEKRFENSGFIRKAFALRMPFSIKVKTEPFGTILSIAGSGCLLGPRSGREL
ncbi:MAG: hypothetical protein L3J13_05320, partial [Devosiaceae bacterium]|nr:hypothetical protein [Devosiaceae bacterium]